MKKVLFLGLGKGIDFGKYIDFDIWTLNDFYSFHEGLKPHTVFEIHEGLDYNEMKKQGRFLGNVVEQFNASGARIITTGDKGFDNQCEFDWKRGRAEFGDLYFTGTYSNMFAIAHWEGYGYVEIQGMCMLTRDEYQFQVHGLLRNIDDARNRGMLVYSPQEKTWRSTCMEIPEEYRGIYGLKP